ncbi:MAG: maleylpyruvate isomerase family mycothiol-dependent enzyme [Actinobacteria bacterium]|nr:maleylpyruvate isomerase family mycothiol-dependent enzyme [Actinomycetota bacterium]MBI3686110.1 maleylpyruvate isomerase family mycothiol-dependent enzyme [Actinomycetota bacterium]
MAIQDMGGAAPGVPADALPRPAAYRTIRDEIRRLVTQAPEAADTPVPACPEWTVRETVAHLTGNCHTAIGIGIGIGAGRVGPPDPDWTRQQVAGFRTVSLDALLAIWDEAAAELEQRWAAGATPSTLLLMDATAHRFDLGIALGEPPPHEHPVLPAMVAVVTGGFARAAASHQLPVLRLRTDTGQEWVIGAGEPAGTVHASRYDLFRSLTGRRTAVQIRALDWDGDPTPWLPAFRWGPFVPPAEPTE